MVRRACCTQPRGEFSNPGHTHRGANTVCVQQVVEMTRRKESKTWVTASMTLAEANTESRLLREAQSQAQLRIEDLESQVRVLKNKAELATSPSKATDTPTSPVTVPHPNPLRRPNSQRHGRSSTCRWTTHGSPR